MKLLTRLFARYAAHLGYLDGKRNFPGEHDFVEVSMHGGEFLRPPQPRPQDAEVLKIAELGALTDRKQ